MKEFPKNNPWLGLRTYTEGQYLYGRATEIESLTRDIAYNRQTVVYGKSGIGKSSLLNAGVFPRLRKQMMFPVNVRLVHKTVEQSYMQQISSAVEDSLVHLRREVIDNEGKVYIKENLKGHSVEVCPLIGGESQESLWEYFHRHKFFDDQGNEIVPVLVIDQFEEIFTLCKDEKQKKFFFSELADLINDVPPEYIYSHSGSSSSNDDTESLIIDGNGEFILSEDDDEVNSDNYEYLSDPQFHIVISLREDFLSYLERYITNIPLLRHNRFCLKPLDDDHAAEIILDPVPGLISKDVAVDIICKVSNAKPTDFIIGDSVSQIEVDSAILSLFLSELFEQRKSQDIIISKELVDEIGDNIIKNFYERTISHISKSSALFLETKLISEDGETVRRDSIFESQAKQNGVTNEELKYLKDERLIHEYPWNNDIRIEFIHDVLCPVIKERKEKREMLHQQELERQRQEEEKRILQKEAERKQRELEEKAARERAEMEAEARKVRRRNLRIYTFVALFFGATVLCGTYYYYSKLYTYKTYYKEFTRINGWPVGIGNQLSDQEKECTPLYYCLSHKGCDSPIMKLFGISSDNDLNTDVEVLSSNPRLPHKPRIASLEIVDAKSKDEKALIYNELLSNICKIHFVGGENNTIEKEVAFNDKDSILFVINYFHINNSEMWSSFVTPTGQAMQIREDGIDRIKISLDSLGRTRTLMYYDQNGVIQPIYNNVCGYAWEFDAENMEAKQYILDQFSLPIENNYNMIETKQFGDTIIKCYRHVLSLDDNVGIEALGPEGFCLTKQVGNKVLMYVSESAKSYSTKTVTYDAKGNILAEQIINNLSLLVPSITKYTYNEDGNLIKLEKRTSANHPFVVDEMDDYLYEWKYSGENIISEIRRNKTQVTYMHTIEKGDKVTKELWEDIYANKYLLKVDSIFKDGYSTSYFGRNNLPVNYKVRLEEDSIIFHRKRCFIRDNEELRYFYVFDGTEKKAPLIKTAWGQAISYYCKEIKKNTEGQIVSYKERDEDNRIIKSMMFFTLNGQVIGRAVEGIEPGTPVRCNNWEEEGYMYYKIYYVKDFEDNFVGIHGKNEWGQASVFFDPSPNGGYQSVLYQDFKGHELILNPSRKINIIRSYKQYVLNPAENISDFSYPYLHILDKASCLYKAGFKDGDRIIKFGSWSIGNSFVNLSSEWTVWSNTGKPMRIEALRPIQNGSVERIIRNIGCSQSSKDLQEYHVVSLTTEEYNYLSTKSILK